MAKKELKKIVQALRRKGKSYSEIKKAVGVDLSKSTLSCWCKEIVLTPTHLRLMKKRIDKKLSVARKLALKTNKRKREFYFNNLRNTNLHLVNLFDNPDISKLMLAMLFLCEGSKKTRGSLVFCNSDPLIIKLFLRFLRKCYKINKKKFRCTLQCRADQNIKYLENFWSDITRIPPCQFYKARIDPRTIGKPSKKKEYKGVCRIDYLSADVYNELKIFEQIL